MSRELKFRSWVNGHWVGWIPTCKTHGAYNASVVDTDGYTYEKENPFIVEQYTGLKDKNGKEIYEGDIVFCKQCNENHVIEWSDNAACFDSWQSDGSGCVWFGESHEKINYTVIGNIHENPELLGGEE